MVSAAGPNLPALVPPAKVNLNAGLFRPLTGLPDASLTTRVSWTLLPDTTVALENATVESALTVPGVTVICGCDLRSMLLMFTVQSAGRSAVVPVKTTV